MVQVDSEAADFERLSTALVLACINTSIQLQEHLIVTGKKRPVEYFGVAQVYPGFQRLRRDHNALPLRSKLAELQIELCGTGNIERMHRRYEFGSFDPERVRPLDQAIEPEDPHRHRKDNLSTVQ